MEEVDVLVLGAGPAGLAAAYSLLKEGLNVVVLEKENAAGGLMRAITRDEFTLDFGYKHLYNRIPEVHAFWKRLLGNDFIEYRMRTGMLFGNRVFEKDRAFKGMRRGMPYGLLLSAFADLLKCRFKYRPKRITSLQDFAYSRRGKKFTTIFTQGYDERLKGRKWAQLPVPQSAVTHGTSKRQNFILQFLKDAEANKSVQSPWFHPAKGTGQIAEELEKQINGMGCQIDFETEVTSIDHHSGQIGTVRVKKGESSKTFRPKAVISSLPLEIMTRLMSLNVKPAARELSFHRSVAMVYLFLNNKVSFPYTSIQVSCPEIQMGRITNYEAFGGRMVPSGKGCLCVEFFCLSNSVLFKMKDKELLALCLTECESAGLLHRENCFDHLVIKRSGADPATSWEDYVTDPSRRQIYKTLEGCSNLYPVNRTGLDKSTYAGLMAAKAIVTGNRESFLEKTRPDIFNIHQAKVGN